MADKFVHNALPLHNVAQALDAGRAVEVGAGSETFDFGAAHYIEEPKKKKRYTSSRDKGVGSHRDGVK